MRRYLALAAITAVLAVPSPVQAAKSCPQYEAALARYFPRKAVPTLSYVAWRESRCNPSSVSAVRRSTGYPDVGLLQIQGSWRTVTRQICRLRPNENHIKALTRLDCNLRVARYLYDNGGMAHWRGSSSQK